MASNKLTKILFESSIFKSIFRVPLPKTDRERSSIMISSFFLHIQPAKVHKNTLRPTYTFGLGLIAFYLFIILTLSGILLMFYYIPSVDEAYNNIKELKYTVAFGTFLRNLHRFSAHAMVLIVFLHMLRVFYTAAYKPPREFNWIIGVILFLFTLFLSFTGYLLPWDQLAYWAITVGTSIAGYAPIFGEKIKFLLLGGNSVGQNALIRFYVLHVVVLPLFMTILICIHFYRIRKDGGLSWPNESNPILDSPKMVESNKSETKTYGLMALVKGKGFENNKLPEDYIFAWPNLVLAELSLFIFVLIVMSFIAIFFNSPLEEPANPFHPTNPAKAPWYFLGLQELVSYSAFIGGILIPTLFILGLILLPYIDKKRTGVGIWFAKERRVVIFIFSLIMLALIIFTVVGTVFRGENWSFVVP